MLIALSITTSCTPKRKAVSAETEGYELRKGIVSGNHPSADMLTQEPRAVQVEYIDFLSGTLGQLKSSADPLLPSADIGAWDTMHTAGNVITLPQVRTKQLKNNQRAAVVSKSVRTMGRVIYAQ